MTNRSAKKNGSTHVPWGLRQRSSRDNQRVSGVSRWDAKGPVVLLWYLNILPVPACPCDEMPAPVLKTMEQRSTVFSFLFSKNVSSS